MEDIFKNQYKLEKSKERAGWWVCTDTINLIVCRFKEHEFNETQETTLLDDSMWQPIMPEDIKVLAGMSRSLAEWLRQNHYDLVF